MLTYYLRLAVSSIRHEPVMSALMIGAVALGIGVSMTIFSTYYLMAGDPIPHKSDRLYTVQIDSWGKDGPFDDDTPEEPPFVLTYKDSVGILGSGIPEHEAPMYKTGLTVIPDNDDINPFRIRGRLTSSDFFSMFDVPFLYGGSWDKHAYDNAERVIVIDRNTNDKLFGGSNSVGKTVRLDKWVFTIVGVRDHWEPQPKFYDVEGGAFGDSESFYAPYTLFQADELPRMGSTNCWKEELIDSYQALLRSECVWPNVWVELSSSAQRDDYANWLDNYVLEQQKLGRLERPLNNRLRNVMEWLSYRQVVSDDGRTMVVIAFLFLIVCLVNMIGLLLARFIGKSSVVGVRLALGASKSHIFTQHLFEVGIIGFVGGVLGLLLAVLGFEGVKSLWPEFDAFARLDFTLVAMGLGLAIFASLLAGLYPAWRVCRTNPSHYLKTQ